MYDEFVMVEFALPWHRDVSQTPGFPEAVAEAAAEAKAGGRRLQVQAFAPDDRSVPGRRRVMYFRRPPAEGGAGADDDGVLEAAPFDGVEYVVAEDALPALLRLLLFGEGEADRFESYRVHRRGVRDLFVCTHGARDACCGKFGAALLQQLQDMVGTGAAADGRGVGSDDGAVRVWRVSHIGGHRFAPTVIDLPSGRYWGGLVDGALKTLLANDGSLDGLRPYYRGWTGLRSAQEQVAEAEAWRRVGATWQRRKKWIWTVASAADPELTTVAVEWRDPDTGAEGRFEVDVAVSHVIELPESCGKEEIQSKQWMVVRFDEA